MAKKKWEYQLLYTLKKIAGKNCFVLTKEFPSFVDARKEIDVLREYFTIVTENIDNEGVAEITIQEDDKSWNLVMNDEEEEPNKNQVKKK